MDKHIRVSYFFTARPFTERPPIRVARGDRMLGAIVVLLAYLDSVSRSRGEAPADHLGREEEEAGSRWLRRVLTASQHDPMLRGEIHRQSKLASRLK